MSALFLSILIACCFILIIGSKIYRERKNNLESFKKECLHTSWNGDKCRHCGITYKEK